MTIGCEGEVVHSLYLNQVEHWEIECSIDVSQLTAMRKRNIIILYM